ncbi:unnamed protein product, partial [Prorocentrum cordatum]
MLRMFATVLKLATPALNLDKFLIPEGGAEIESEQLRQRRRRAQEIADEKHAEDQRAKDKDASWARKRQKFCEDHGIRLRLPSTVSTSPAFELSCKRHREIIAVAERMHDKKLLAVDVNPNIDRGMMMHDTDLMATFVRGTKNYLT